MRINLLIHTFAAGLMFASCQSTPKVDRLEDSADVSAEMGKLQQQVSAAQKDQQDVLAPTSFHEAEHFLNEAAREREKGESNKQILSSIGKGNAWIRQANELANDRKEDLKEVLATRNKALTAGAAAAAETELTAADRKLNEYTETKGRLSMTLADKEELQKLYTRANIAAVKNRYLSTSRGNLNQAKKEGAQKAVPNTLAEVEKSLQNAEVFAEVNYYKEAEFAQMAKGVEDSTTRLLNLTRQAKIDKNKTPEQIALDKEAAAAMVAASQQSAEAAAQAAAASQAEVANTNTKLSEEAKRAEAYRASEQREATVRSMFNPSEADVVRTSEGTVIRLKGLKYASGKSELTSEDYKLLTKARDALKTLGATSIVVEGHTDAVGSPKKNQQISERRAEAVKKYLESSGDLKNLSIEAQGAGDQKPLTSNRTTIGRAQNRRVDLILKGTNANAAAM